MNAYLAGLAVYSALLIATGIYVGRQVRNSADFLVAGRRLGPGLVFTTFIAANIGAGSTVGAAGIGYRSGLSAWWWVGSAGIGSVILGAFVGPRIWEIAHRNGFHTVGDFLEARYSPSVRRLIAILLWIGSLALLAGQLIAVSKILEIVVGLPKWQGCLIGGIIVTAYFTAGGLWTSVWVNAVQIVVMFAGFAAAVPFALRTVGGWDRVVATLERSNGPEYFSLTGIGIEGILAYAVILVPSFIVSPGLIQKLYGGRDVRAVRWGIHLNAAGLLAFAFIPALMGMIARSQFPALADPELAMPRVMMDLLPGWLGMLGLAAVFSAEISTCDAILFMLSSSLTVDLYKSVLNPAATDRQLLTASRIAAITGAGLGTLQAVLLGSIISALSIFYSVLAVALFVPLMVGLYSRSPKTGLALATIAGSVAGMLIVQFATGGKGFGVLNPAAAGILTGLMIMGVGRWTRMGWS